MLYVTLTLLNDEYVNFIDWNCEFKKYNSNLKGNEKQLSLWGNLSYRAKFKWNFDQRKGKFAPVSGEFK